MANEPPSGTRKIFKSLAPSLIWFLINPKQIKGTKGHPVSGRDAYHQAATMIRAMASSAADW